MSSLWYKARDDVLKRDNNTCQICGRVKGMLFVHHKQPKRFGGSDSLDNLITLCATCHSGAEWGFIGEGIKKRLNEIMKDSKWFHEQLSKHGINGTSPYWKLPIRRIYA